MVTWDEIKVALHQEGREEEATRKLMEFVALFWDEATGQAFEARLEKKDARVWPALRDLRAAYEEGGCDPCALLDASGTLPTPGANDRPSTVT